MNIFLDSADYQIIAKLSESGLVDGITTNPTHLSKQQEAPRLVVEKICALLPGGPVSVEITKKDPQEVYNQAKEIAAIAPNVVVKIPCHPLYTSIISQLIQEGIAINITLVFTTIQALLMAKLGVAFVSPFIGRLEDKGVNGIQLLEEIRTTFDNYCLSTQILAASVRTLEHVTAAAIIGVDAITLPPAIFESLLLHPLTDAGIATFDKDWQNIGISQFP